MKTRLIAYWDSLRSSFWFLPLVMAIAAILLAVSTVSLDAFVSQEWLHHFGWAYAGGAEGASAVLSTIAGSMITIAGVVFSLTLVALSLASAQFGPRLLRNFMRDTTNQIVLGTFVSTFLYCLLVLRTIRRQDEDLFVPNMSVTMGVFLAIASLVLLIYFIHHVSMSIQADEVISRVGAELLDAMDRVFPEKWDTPDERSKGTSFVGTLPDGFEQQSKPIFANEDGYIRLVNADRLLEIARENDLVMSLECRPGQYVISGHPFARVWPGMAVNEAMAKRINGSFVLGNQRTPVQDLEFPIAQLVEIAVRALSPGINDPFTAMSCVDRLGSAMGRLAGRKLPSSFLCDENDRLRIVAPALTFSDVVDTSLNAIRHYAKTSAMVNIRILQTIASVAELVRRPSDREVLRRHAAMILRSATGSLTESDDIKQLQDNFDAAIAILDGPDASQQNGDQEAKVSDEKQVSSKD